MLRFVRPRCLLGALLAITAVHAIPQGSLVGTTTTTPSTTSADVGADSTTQVTVTSTFLGTTDMTITSTGTPSTLSTSSTSSTSSKTSTSLARVATALPPGVACNNSPLLCNRAYNNITHLGAHNSPFLRDADIGYSVAGNQYFNTTVSLSGGVRLLQAQVHFQAGILQLCHSSCTLMDAGTLKTWLSDIKSWLDANPNEVVTLLLVNSDSVSVEFFAAAFEQSGMPAYSYIPPFTSASSTTVWPTLGELISANTRLVTFIAGVTPSTYYPYLLDEWQYVFETPYEVTSPEFLCTVDRPTTFSSSLTAVESGMLPLLNHFSYVPLRDGILVPNEYIIDQTNSPSERDADAGALGLHIKTCEAEWKAKPVFVLVDFWDRGPALEAVDLMNGVDGMTEGRTEPVPAALAESGTSARFGSAEQKAALVRLVGLVVAVAFLL